MYIYIPLLLSFLLGWGELEHEATLYWVVTVAISSVWVIKELHTVGYEHLVIVFDPQIFV